MVHEKQSRFCNFLGQGLLEEEAREEPSSPATPTETLPPEQTAPGPPRRAEGGNRSSIWFRFLRRRRYLVYPSLQLRLLADHLCGLLILSLVLAGVTIFPLVCEFQDYRGGGGQHLDRAITFLFLHERFWLVFGLGIVTVALLSIRSTHRVAGALFRFRLVFRRMARGLVPFSIRLRREDFLHREEQEFNRVLAGLWAGIGELEDARKGLAGLVAVTRGETRRRLRRELARVERGMEHLRRDQTSGK